MKVLELSFEVQDKLTLVDGLNMVRAIERAARRCYGSADRISEDSYEPLLRHVLSRGHESVLEHEKVSVVFVMDRGISHELVRHRHASPSQESTRYCNYGSDRFGGEIKVIPMLDGLPEDLVQARMDLYEHCERVYLNELSRGVTPQQARDNLPTCLKTEMTFTCNLREWRHIFKMRTHPDAHPQVRKLLTPLLKLFKSRIPVVFDDLGEEDQAEA